jgi:hypothetical protein
MADKVTSEIRNFASQLVSRIALLNKLGTQYGGDRDIYKALGYPNVEEVGFADLYSRYRRQDIAKAVIDKPVDYSWRGPLAVSDGGYEDSKFEKEFSKMECELGLKSILVQADKLTGLGQYGVLLLGCDDVKVTADWQKPLREGAKLKYVKAYGEGSIDINRYEKSPGNSRFGKPDIYQVTTNKYDAEGNSSVIMVHHTRVIHIVDNNLISDIKGDSRLLPVLNRLYDLEKLVGGSAEMFWRGARPGMQAITDKDYTLGDDAEEKLKEQIDEYEHNLRRIIAAQGIEMKELKTQVADPKNHVDIVIQMISAETSIPKRILTGSERGELSSEQDSDEWKSYIKGRRSEFVEKQILHPFINRLINFGILPKPKEGIENYEIVWEDLFSQSDKEKGEIAKSISSALKEYGMNPSVQSVIPPKAFMKFVLKFSDQTIEEIESIRGEEIQEEINQMEGIEEEQEEINETE